MLITSSGIFSAKKRRQEEGIKIQENIFALLRKICMDDEQSKLYYQSEKQETKEAQR